MAYKDEPTTPTLFVRREVGGLGSDDETWDDTMRAYADAVATMQARDDDDPTSWNYQAGIHGRDPQLPQHPLFGTCEHAIWHFLDWHRMYLLQFEAIVRAAVVANGGPEDWALPFWDYGREGEGPKRLPWVFRQQFREDGTTPNPLFVAQRNPNRNGGTPIPARDTSHAAAFLNTRFVGTGGPDVGFAGIPPSLGRTFGGIENLPHNAIHVAIGGWMGHPWTAGQDPIFWLHHCNIDRLWELWNRQGNATTDDAGWLGGTFDFFDASGTRVTMASSGVLEIEAQLGYTYQGLPAPVEPAVEGGLGLAPEGDDVSDIPAEMVGATDDALVLADGVTSAGLSLSPSGPGRFGLDEEPQRVFLVVDNVTAQGAPSANYSVVLDMGEPGDRDDFVVGVLSFFGVEQAAADDTDRGAHGLRLSLEITDVVNTLRERGLWDEANVRLRFEPTEPVQTTDVTRINVGRVSVFYQ